MSEIEDVSYCSDLAASELEPAIRAKLAKILRSRYTNNGNLRALLLVLDCYEVPIDGLDADDTTIARALARLDGEEDERLLSEREFVARSVSNCASLEVLDAMLAVETLDHKQVEVPDGEDPVLFHLALAAKMRQKELDRGKKDVATLDPPKPKPKAKRKLAKAA